MYFLKTRAEEGRGIREKKKKKKKKKKKFFGKKLKRETPIIPSTFPLASPSILTHTHILFSPQTLSSRNKKKKNRTHDTYSSASSPS
jgi:hypothetical protein